MEKLLSRLRFLLILFPLICNAQSKYAVFEVKGSPIHTEASKKGTLTKGAVVRAGEVSLKNEDQLTLLNNKGEVFQLKSPGKYAVSNFEKFKMNEGKEGFSSKYFAYVWREINSEENTKTNTGNIYRDGLIDILISPADSISTYMNKVVFTWAPIEKASAHYFFLKENATNSITKMKVEGDSLTIFVGGNLLKKGNVYSWGVSNEEYPDFTRIKMNQLNYLDKNTYDTKKAELDSFVKNLRKLGLSEKEITEKLCTYFKFCE